MEKLHWFINPVKNQYTDFTGRTTRKNFWMYVLCYWILYIGLAIVSLIIQMEDVLTGLFALAVLLPSIAITTRRLHDVGKSGWWQLITLIPILGIIVLIYFTAQEGDKGANMYGEDPLVGEVGVRDAVVVEETPVAAAAEVPPTLSDNNSSN